MWLALKNKVLTWDSIQKQSTQGPKRCILCKSNLEPTNQFLFSYPFTLQVSQELEKMTGILVFWEEPQ